MWYRRRTVRLFWWHGGGETRPCNWVQCWEGRKPSKSTGFNWVSRLRELPSLNCAMSKHNIWCCKIISIFSPNNYEILIADDTLQIHTTISVYFHSYTSQNSLLVSKLLNHPSSTHHDLLSPLRWVPPLQRRLNISHTAAPAAAASVIQTNHWLEETPWQLRINIIQ